MEPVGKRFPNLFKLVKSWITWKTEPDSISRAFWMPDDSCMVCYECDSQFTVFNRRHHCRKCGRIFCAKCTSNFIPVNSYESESLQQEGELIRVCNFCFKQREDVTTARYEAEPSSPILSPSLSNTSFDSTKSSGAGNSSLSAAVSYTYSGGAFQQPSYAPAPSPNQSVQLENCFDKQDLLIEEGCMDSLVDNGDHSPTRFGLCLNRSDDEEDDFGTCQWDSEEQRYANSDEFYGPLEFDESVKRCGSHKPHPAEGDIDTQEISVPLLDNRNYHTHLSTDKVEEHCTVNNVECDTSSSIFGVDTSDAEPMDFENNKQLWLPPEPENEEDEKEAVFFEDEEDDATGEWRYMRSLNSFGSFEHRNRDRSIEEHKKAMKNVVEGHFRALVAQLLQVENLPISEDGKEGWLDILTSLSWEAAMHLKPDTSSGGGMDPGLYVKIKCLACGHRRDSMVVKGVVCKKNVANRRMPSKIEKARFLILGGALEYQRVSNLLSSIDTLLQQEMDHLKMAIAKIDSHHPNVLLVEKTVSRCAQDYLLAKNISLVLNVKRPLLERIARCTGADIVPSIDHLSSSNLGHCELFHVEKFVEEHDIACQDGKKLKTLMFFRGCPKPLGCTILLKGACSNELKKVKHVLQYGVFAAYHLALETSFLADEGASLPELPLKSPITVALPDKPSMVNRSISTIPGFTISPADKSQSSSVVQTSGKSDPNLGPETGSALRLSYEDNTSLSNSDSAVVNMHDLSFDKGNQLNNMGEQCLVPFVSSSHSVTAPSYSLGRSACHTGEEIMADFLRGNEPGCMETHKETSISHQVQASNLHENRGVFEDGRGTDCDVQRDDLKSIKLHRDNSRNDDLVTKEEFPPSPSDHQSILVSLSSRCVWKGGTVCERAHLFRFKYYGSFDRPLGRYLRDHLFNQSYKCRTCEMPSEVHIYCYTHRQGSLTISVKKLEEFVLPGARDGKIWMWHRCLCCPRANGLPPATPRIVMSDAAWGLSFGKFLELSFSNHAAASRVASCGHSLHRDCLRFYGYGEMVACFKYAPINIHSVYLPPSILDFNYQHQDWVQEETDKLSNIALDLFAQVQKSLHQLEENISNAANMKVLEGILLKERAEFEESVRTVTKKEETDMQPFVDILEVNKLQRKLLFQSYVWDKQIKFATDACTKGLPTKNKEELAPRVGRSFTNSDSSVSVTSAGPHNGSGSKDEDDQYKQPSDQQKLDLEHESTKVLSTSTTASNQTDFLESHDGPHRVVSVGQYPIMDELSNTLDAKWIGENGPTLVDASKLNLSGLDDTTHIESSENVEESYHIDSNSTSTNTSRSCEHIEDVSVFIKTSVSDLYASLNKDIDGFLSAYHPESIHVFKELLQKGWGRLFLPLGVNDTAIPIYDDEPTSVISYALVCADYHSQISDEPEKLRDGRESPLSFTIQDYGNSFIFQSLDDIPFETFKSLGSIDDSTPSIPGSKSPLTIDPLASTKSMHVRVSFATRYSVTCYYAKHFEALRKTCCPSELDFIRSLSRCKKWGAQGGKSNVFFAKSLDDRFIIKQVTKTELESFIKFAPEYFKYLTESINTGCPTCLAKILGIYQVLIKNSKGGKESKMDVLVMENLLFGRSVEWLYDLKGSSRSRYNADSSGNNKVLLDQNLIEAMPTSPIFVGNKAKRLLERAVWNDTAFLASIDVMDYSLLVGVDENKQELVLGIIDFMRQYTWDKHLETWVKASGILGGPKDASPTVISPKQYKKRFRKAMSAYFIVVPDQWSPPTIIPSQSQSDLCRDDLLAASPNL
ncbi:1-phosphatidylinositol-3-phosphate 5-kinase FAB1B-like isoform X1 [Zingiber officinale]|uniref:1-phosphatidylinositol-3-phosphate 5-kinase FAB1B-like isoform X1 n=1 Tax=Zingiber officinale TaxID=94328 RepID=UPI001C4C82F2|nr:1-phosphatidylinositol-3-phosphate 5-kinase FAB1B-like isoform X1 [Zingiber officinale]XP_042398156.1 1-phosphatidylinositol-3-phosphate 5-kinase FAB1B-like isoform X1 [Zingiber officinale]XP_042398157.1 1-phosphatidylinositol-3-phosphate 5-kinase FAB1B-like isoform X1 [Zingiber officinale]XP_042398158.1 1-phosphatidylinositol-3-phosphate 5-kinase FAB1B-like isoform X1 [Zingiber officinale]